MEGMKEIEESDIEEEGTAELFVIKKLNIIVITQK